MKLAKEMKDDSKGRIRVAFTSFLQICLLSAGQKLVRMHTWTRILRHFSSRHGEILLGGVSSTRTGWSSGEIH